MRPVVSVGLCLSLAALTAASALVSADALVTADESRARNPAIRGQICSSHGGATATDLDAIIGRALYTRGVGNRYPDTDPKPTAQTRRRP